jgi:putative addiction module component (TIGR02574 family)
MTVDERLSLLDKLLHVITVPTATEIEKAWLEESHKRLADIRSGKAQAIPGEVVFSRVWGALARGPS